MDTETLMFFTGHETALPIYEAWEDRLMRAFPDTEKRVQKTQITFSNRNVFACVSFLRARRKADLPDPYLVVTLGLPYELPSERAAVRTEPYPGRWTTHIVLGSAQEVDDELMGWTAQAYAFTESKR